MSQNPFVIVGASLAGAKAAEELRERGFEGPIVLIGSEADRPYERPPLSKEYLRGETEREKAFVHDERFYEEHRIELLTGATATALDPSNRTVTLDDGRELRFERLLLTVGAQPRRLPVRGAELKGVHYLRTLADCDALRADLGGREQVVVIGAGWIGCEVAASLRQRGLKVTLLAPEQVPLERVLGAELGEFYRDLHARHGVQLRLGEGVEELHGGADGRVRGVRTSGGETLGCELVVVGVGVSPRVELARAGGLEVGDGVLVDERLESSAAGVFAAGDVAAAWHPFYGQRVRVEHWANALNQGPAAARAMLGATDVYQEIPYFFSDQYDAGMEYSGHAPEYDEIVFRGDREGGEFIAFWLGQGRVLAGMNVNVWDVNEHVQALIRSRRVIDTNALRDPDTPLAELAGA